MPRKRSRAEGVAHPIAGRHREHSATRLSESLLRAAAIASLAGAVPALAERVDLEPSVAVRVTASDNAGLGFTTSGSDVVSDVTAGLRVRAEGSRLSLTGNAALRSFVYARQTQSNDTIPSVDLTGRWVAVERLLFIEAAGRTTQTRIDPFGPSVTSTSTDNNRTVTQYRLTPIIDSEPRPNLHLLARSDNVKTKDDGVQAAGSGAVDGSYFATHSASLEQDPLPVGWGLNAQRTYTRYQGGFVPLVSDVGRVLVNVAIAESGSVGLRWGSERNNFLTDAGWRPVYGGQASWRPSERTTLSFDIEHRFFGKAAHLAFTHRMPFLSWDLRVNRDIDTTPRSLFSLGPTDNVAGLLDLILTTRFPDAAERARQVQDLIARQGLPASTPSAISILEPRLSVVESGTLGVSYLGVRNTVTLTAFSSRSRDALQTGPLATNDPTTNNLQNGASLVYALRVTPTATAGLTVTWSRIRALDSASSAASTKDGSVRGQLVVQMAPKTFGTVGAQYRRLASSIVSSGRETFAFVAVEHRF
jgi:uncharacterized protein (PEP-CTERM system associated)